MDSNYYYMTGRKICDGGGIHFVVKASDIASAVKTALQCVDEIYRCDSVYSFTEVDYPGCEGKYYRAVIFAVFDDMLSRGVFMQKAVVEVCEARDHDGLYYEEEFAIVEKTDKLDIGPRRMNNN